MKRYRFALILAVFALAGCRTRDAATATAQPATATTLAVTTAATATIEPTAEPPPTAAPPATIEPTTEPAPPTAAPPTATAEPVVPSATDEPLPTATAAPPTATPTPAIDPVLAACDPAEQAKAVRAGQPLDWASLALNACYDLAMRIEPEARRYDGTLRLTFTNRTTDTLSELLLRTYPNADVVYGGALAITSAAVDDTAVEGEVILADETGYRVPLPEPVAPEESVVVTVEFEGTIPVDLGGSKTTYGIFNLDSASQTAMLANAFPLLAPYRPGAGYHAPEVLPEGDAVTAQSALFRLRLLAPAEQQVIASGVEIGREDGPDGTTHTIVTGPTRDLAIILSPALGSTTTEVDGVRIVSHFQPGEEAPGRDSADLTARAVRLFDQAFGPYPFSELDVVPVPLQNAAGVEYPGLFVVEEETYTDPERRQVFEVATVHEAAHQWWYSAVGNNVYSAPWQDEALTTWSSLYFFQVERPDFGEGMRRSWERTVSEYEAENGVEPIAQPLDAFAGRGNAFGVIVYLKGALFFDALRRDLGDEAFFGALRQYYAEQRFAIAAPGDLLGAFEAASGRDLDEFYRTWGVLED